MAAEMEILRENLKEMLEMRNPRQKGRMPPRALPETPSARGTTTETSRTETSRTGKEENANREKKNSKSLRATENVICSLMYITEGGRGVITENFPKLMSDHTTNPRGKKTPRRKNARTVIRRHIVFKLQEVRESP